MTSLQNGPATDPAERRISTIVQGIVIALIAVLAGNVIRALQGGGVTDPILGLIFLEDWKLSQYYFKYSEIGFTKRALIGTLLDIEAARAVPVEVFLLLFAAILVTAILFSRVIAHAGFGPRILFLLSPAIFLQIGYDFGRFDLINTALLMVFLAINARALPLFVLVMLLIHEGAIASHVPMLFLIHYLKHGLGRVTYVSAALALVALVAIVALSNKPSTAEILALYPTLNPDSVGIYEQTIKNSVYISLQRILGMDLLGFAGFGLCMAYLAALAVPLLRTRNVLALLICLAPLALSIAGLDYARWIALSSFNVILMTALCVRTADMPKGWALAVLPFTVLGPMGIFFPLPLVSLLFGGGP